MYQFRLLGTRIALLSANLYDDTSFTFFRFCDPPEFGGKLALGHDHHRRDMGAARDDAHPFFLFCLFPPNLQPSPSCAGFHVFLFSPASVSRRIEPLIIR